MRNFLAHVYWKVDPYVVWETATVHLPPFAARIAQLGPPR